jgi:hypothetical protein
MMKVFISDAHTDAPLVKKVAAGLKEAGLEVWDDTREIMPGDNWADKVEALAPLPQPDNGKALRVALFARM